MRKFTILFCLTLFGCTDSSGPDTDDDPPTGGGCPVATVAPLVAGAYGVYTNTQAEFVSVADPVSWSFLHRWVAGLGPVTPTVNFSTEIVAGIIGGTFPNGSAQVVFGDPGTDTVHAHIDPGGGLPGFAGKPYGFINLQTSSGVVIFNNCGGLIVAVPKDYPSLVMQEYADRTMFPTTPPGQVPALVAGNCPLDGTVLAVAVLNPTDSAHYCTTDGAYWVQGTVGWFGPFWVGDGEPTPPVPHEN